MTETAIATANVQPTAAAPAPAATTDKAPTPASADTLIDDGIEGDEPAAEAAPDGDLKQDAEGEPAERPAWARPDDPDAAEAWREERGVPLDPDDYELPIADPDQLDDNAQQTIAGFTKLSHELDLPQESASKMFEFATTRAKEIMAARVEQDRAEAASAKQVLSEQWGENAGANLKSVNALLKSLPGNLSKAIREARSANGLGSRLANEPAFLALLSEYAALKAGGPTAGIFDGQADEKRIVEIKRARSDDFGTYIRHGLDKELATLEARQASRAPAAEGPRPGDAAREAKIMKAMRANYDKYKADGLDIALAAIRTRRGA